MTPRERLAAAAGPLLDPGAPLGEQRAAAEELFALCCELAGLRPDAADLGDEPTPLPEGRALGPLSAARCLLDFARTAAFLRGLRAALAQAQARFGAPVEVLYAGCGPFAPLFLPLTTALPPGTARFTLLDLHPQSVAVAARLVEAFRAGPWLAGLRADDAFAFKPQRPVHVAVVETMQRALEHEPQAALMARLARLLAPGGLLLPEEVELGVALADLGREFGPGARRREPLGTLLRLTRQTLAEGAAAAEASLACVVPDEAEPGHALVLTRVRVLGPQALGDYDSGLTYPLVLHGLGLLDPGCAFEVCWRGGPDPQVGARLLSAGS